jgi:hypothetical protein
MSVPVRYQSQFQLPLKKLLLTMVGPCHCILISNLKLEVYTGQCQWAMLVFWLLVAQDLPLASTMGLGLMDLMLGGVGQCQL